MGRIYYNRNKCINKRKKKNNVIYGIFNDSSYHKEKLLIDQYSEISERNYVLLDVSIIRGIFTVTIFQISFLLYLFVVQHESILAILSKKVAILALVCIVAGFLFGASVLSFIALMLSKRKAV